MWKCVLGNAGTIVAHGQQDILSMRQISMRARRRFAYGQVSRCNDQLALRGHRVSRISEEPIVLDDPADPISTPSPGPPPQETLGGGTDFASVGPPVEVGPMPSEPSSLPVIEGLLRRGEASERDAQETTGSRVLTQPTTESFDDLRKEFEGSQAPEIPGPSSSEVGARLGSEPDDSPAPQIPGRDIPQMSSAEPTLPTSANPLEEDPLGLGFPQVQPAATVSPVLIQPGQEELNIPLEVRTGNRVQRYRLRLQISLGQED